MTRTRRNAFCWSAAVAAVLSVVVMSTGRSHAQTGTFLDKLSSSHLRVATYNLGGFIANDSGFQFVNDGGGFVWEFIPSNARVVSAIGADVWAFQEIDDRSALQVREAMDRADPLPGGASWNVVRTSNQVIASRHPFTDTNAGLFGSPRSPAVVTVDVPSGQGSTDFHFVNIHLKAGGSASDESRRIEDVDRIVQYLREARIDDGGRDDLPQGLPFVVLGDYNTAAGQTPVNNLLLGNIEDEARYGPDDLLDWDDTTLTQAAPRHNGRETAAWTFRNGGFTSRLDYHVYSDSVTALEQSFVLNTQTMTAAERDATGLEFNDVLFNPSQDRWDHLPVVVDYSTSFVVIPEPSSAVLLMLCSFAACGRRRERR